MKTTKKLRKFDKALTELVLEKPELQEAATTFMDEVVKAYGGDPIEERTKAAVDNILGPTRRISEYY